MYNDFSKYNAEDSYKIITSNENPISFPDWENIWQISIVKHLKRGEVFLNSGKISRYSAFVIEGIFKQSINDQELNQRNLNFYFKGDLLCDCQSYRTNQPAVGSITALEAAVILVVNNDELYRLKNTVLSIALWSLSVSQSIMQKQSEHLQIISIQNPVERYTYMVHNKAHMVTKISSKEIARYLNVSRETISRVRLKMVKSIKPVGKRSLQISSFA